MKKVEAHHMNEMYENIPVKKILIGTFIYLAGLITGALFVSLIM